MCFHIRANIEKLVLLNTTVLHFLVYMYNHGNCQSHMYKEYAIKQYIILKYHDKYSKVDILPYIPTYICNTLF